jgi:hypothetical protein
MRFVRQFKRTSDVRTGFVGVNAQPLRMVGLCDRAASLGRCSKLFKLINFEFLFFCVKTGEMMHVAQVAHRMTDGAGDRFRRLNQIAALCANNV